MSADETNIEYIMVRATERQVNRGPDSADSYNESGNGCITNLTFCQDQPNPQKIHNVTFCNTLGNEISQIIECTTIQQELCDKVNGLRTTAQWADNTMSMDLLVTCPFKVEDMIKTCQQTGGCGGAETFEIIHTENGVSQLTDYIAIDENATYEIIRQYLNTYGENEFQANNIQSLQNNLFPIICFQPTTVCRNNSSTGKPMERCSMIYSSSELGGLCFDWYMSDYSGLMAQRVDVYCSAFTGSDIQWWEDNNGERDPMADFISQDCECVNRFSNPTYQIIREASNVVFNDACWYKPCIPDFNQLKPEINMFSPTCPTTICAQIVNIVNSSIGGDLNVNQYINCSTNYSIEREIQENAQNVWSLTLGILMVVFFLLLALVVAFVGGKLIGDKPERIYDVELNINK